MHRLDRIALIICLIVSGLGLFVMAGWYLHLTALIQLSPAFVPMQFNTAAGLLLAGVGTALIIRRRPRWALACAVAIGVVGILTIYEYTSGQNLGIDVLLFNRYTIVTQTTSPGRMSPITAGLFTASALVLMLLTATDRKRAVDAAAIVSSIIMAVALVACVGYGAGVSPAYGRGHFTSIALHTAIAFTALGTAFLLVAWRREQEQGNTASWAPWAVGIATSLVAAGISSSTIAQQYTQEDAYLSTTADFVRGEVESRVDLDVRTLQRIADRWSTSGQPDGRELGENGLTYESDFPEFEALGWIPAGTTNIEWLKPRTGNQVANTRDLSAAEDRRSALRRAEAGQVVISGVLDLSNGDKGFLVYAPMTEDRKATGIAVGVLSIPAIIGTLPPRLRTLFTIDILQGTHTIYHSAAPEATISSASRSINCDLKDVVWNVTLTPTGTAVAPYQSQVPAMLLCVGLFLATVLACLVQALRRLANASAELQRSQEMLDDAFEHAAIGKANVSPDRKFIRVNQALCNMLGYTKDELMALDTTAITHPDDRAESREMAAKCKSGEIDRYEVEKRYIHRNGSPVWVSLNVALIRDDAGRPLFFASSMLDLTQRRQASDRLSDYAVVLERQTQDLERANAELEHLAITDGLTGVRNRRAFMERLNEQYTLARRYSNPFSVIMADIDSFKAFNDQFGHPAGDEVLRVVAAVLEENARESDFVARYGGEEFAVICSQTDSDGAFRLAERMRLAIEQVNWGVRPITASFGVAELTDDLIDLDALTQAADDALYASKARGRNIVTRAADWRSEHSSPARL